jgi:hypothetical protein
MTERRMPIIAKKVIPNGGILKSLERIIGTVIIRMPIIK